MSTVAQMNDEDSAVPQLRGDRSPIEKSPALSRRPMNTDMHEETLSRQSSSHLDVVPLSRTQSPHDSTGARKSSQSHDPNGLSEKSLKDTKPASKSNAGKTSNSGSQATTHTRRNANGTVGSVYSGNKIRHLKKEDGWPLWRKDIQLEFLRCVFEDDTKCFTMPSDKTPGHSFADIYIDTMARSSKSSKVLKEKLLADRVGAMSMAMICLLVNVGRMNTTLNFFPEMRAQLRTFHAIPSLQANQDPNAYKQLQDAPRLKSILKGASEDLNQPSTLDKLHDLPSPRTNPVHLIFLLSQYAPKVSELHFQPPRDFFDLVMRSTLSSKSRARAFLWLIWWYLESDFSNQAALDNPFGQGQMGDSTDSLPIKVPSFEHLTEAEADAENIDTEEEKQYGEMKRLERKRILEEDETIGPPSKKRRGPDDLPIPVSDTDPARSPSPSMQRTAGVELPMVGGSASFASGDNGASQTRYPIIASKPDGSNSQRLVLKTRGDHVTDLSSPLTYTAGHTAPRRSRQETSYQRAVNHNRRQHVDHILHGQLRLQHRLKRREQRESRSSFGMMIMNRLKELPDMYDTDDDQRSWGPGGLMPELTAEDDYGQEALRYKKFVDRAIRRLARSDGGVATRSMGRAHSLKGRQNVKTTASRTRKSGGPRKSIAASRSSIRSRPGRKKEEQLDDLDLELLGDKEDDQDEDSGLDESDGDDGDLTEEEVEARA